LLIFLLRLISGFLSAGCSHSDEILLTGKTCCCFGWFFSLSCLLLELPLFLNTLIFVWGLLFEVRLGWNGWLSWRLLFWFRSYNIWRLDRLTFILYWLFYNRWNIFCCLLSDSRQIFINFITADFGLFCIFQFLV